jgi:hypothetical protein
VRGFGDALRGKGGVEEGVPTVGVERSEGHGVSIYSIARGG